MRRKICIILTIVVLLTVVSSIFVACGITEESLSKQQEKYAKRLTDNNISVDTGKERLAVRTYDSEFDMYIATAPYGTLGLYVIESTSNGELLTIHIFESKEYAQLYYDDNCQKEDFISGKKVIYLDKNVVLLGDASYVDIARG